MRDIVFLKSKISYTTSYVYIDRGWLKSKRVNNNFTSRAKSNMLNIILCILNLKNNILSYYSKALMQLCKLNTLQA